MLQLEVAEAVGSGVHPETGLGFGVFNPVAKQLERAEHQIFWPEAAES